MKRHIILTLIAVWSFPLMTFNGVWAFEAITRKVVEEKVVEKVDVVKTTDNLIIVFDGSRSTNGMVPGIEMTKIAAAKEILQQRNQWMPDLEYNCGVYLTSGWSALKTVQEMQPCTRETLGSTIDQLPDEGKGNDLLLQSMLKMEKIIEPLSGRTSIIWFTDNTINDIDDVRTPAEIAQKIEEGKDVRFYIVSADESLANGALENVASVNADSKVIPIKTFMDNPDYLAGALFTTKVTSSVQKIPKSEVVGFLTNDTLFDVNSTTIRSEYTQELDKVGKFLQQHPQATIAIQGHTDSAGPEQYNLSLSARRAGQVKDYLLKKFQLDPDRVTALWYGDQQPAANNATAKGRQLNRRVEIAVKGLK